MSSRSPRWVDKIPVVSPRPEEMQVLCLGLSRTGTMSLYTALNKLGYKSYHYIENGKNKKNNHIYCWLEALTAKVYGKGEVWGRAEFDRVLGKYSAVTDAPCANLADGLLAAYPNAKVVLNIRDQDKWLSSMETSFYTIFGWKSWKILAYLDSGIATHTNLLRLILIDWTSGDWEDRTKLRAGFVKHYNHIRSIVPKDNLLEHRPEDGWAPLCKFLGKPIPDEPYPRVNEGNNAANLNRKLFWVKVAILFVRWVLPLGIAIGAGWYYRWRT